MKTTIFFTCMALLIFLYIGDFKISFNPFTINFPVWKIAVAYFLFVVGIVLIQTHYDKTSREEGFVKGHEWTIEKINGILDKKKAEKIQPEKE